MGLDHIKYRLQVFSGLKQTGWWALYHQHKNDSKYIKHCHTNYLHARKIAEVLVSSPGAHFSAPEGLMRTIQQVIQTDHSYRALLQGCHGLLFAIQCLSNVVYNLDRCYHCTVTLPKTRMIIRYIIQLSSKKSLNCSLAGFSRTLAKTQNFDTDL